MHLAGRNMIKLEDSMIDESLTDFDTEIYLVLELLNGDPVLPGFQFDFREIL